VQLPDVIQALEPLQIAWQVQPAGRQATGTFLAAGTSNNRFYEMGGEAPKGVSLYDTVVAVGTKGAAGQNTETDKFNGIWKLFKSPGVGKPPPGIMRSPDADGMVAPLTYYGSWTIALDIQQERKKDPKLPPPQTTASLIKFADGECVAWTRFFLDVLATQGIVQKKSLVTVTVKGSTPANQIALLIKNWKATAGAGMNTDAKTKKVYPFLITIKKDSHIFDFDPKTEKDSAKKYTINIDAAKSDTSKQAGIAGQSNPNPNPIFAGHAAAQLKIDGKTMLYDPSYGLSFADGPDLDKSIVAYIGRAIPKADGSERLVFRKTDPANDLQLTPEDYTPWKG
jgi:hypothetical protein